MHTKKNFAWKKIFLEKVCLSTKFDLQLNNKQKCFGAISNNIWGKFGIMSVVAIKKKLVIHFPCLEIVILAFFDKKFFFFI